MNEQIKKFVEQATTYIDPTVNDGTCWAFDKEKFAQLIVRACAERINWILAEGGKTQGDLLKEYFGVKE